MNIYPAIDIKSGECVRLYQGRYDQVTVYARDPVAAALSFAAQGASRLHIVDLDGARQEKPVNLAVIGEIARQTNLKIQVGGGMRSEQQVYAALKAGVDRVILGSMAISQPALIKGWIQKFGTERIVLALDVRLDEKSIPKLALQGWQTASERTLWELLDLYCSEARHVLCTDISRDGTMRGPNITLYQECTARYPNLQFQASGGINSLNDLKLLAEIPVPSVIVGKALYENNFTYKAALDEVMTC